ncbi:hypothetical protein Sps_01462 [Shewanella psychrophila]|uniref:Pesticin C-terminal domain-containing protein n=1 Tax=Shewanella psychrophila TaxID=225848 RepID=A0A1S6HMB2_9GAMM|nr:pesticin C-terminus-like muramidase [Shewanella psychrophila]AQS36628.1 hypothetical protein Sps_01462 [Shewanella psychrophila]
MKNTMVNFGFISRLEGGPVCKGYVPDPEHSNSGVTIATGFDLGQRSHNDLQNLLPQSLVPILSPYCGMTKQDAVAYLVLAPLEISIDEADLIDLCVKSQLLEQLQYRYNRVSNVSFNRLPERCQTVVASVSFQYGNLANRCPKFWQKSMSQDWIGLVQELRDFGDRYPTRRNQEADYLVLRGKA